MKLDFRFFNLEKCFMWVKNDFNFYVGSLLRSTDSAFTVSAISKYKTPFFISLFLYVQLLCLLLSIAYYRFHHRLIISLFL